MRALELDDAARDELVAAAAVASATSSNAAPIDLREEPSPSDDRPAFSWRYPFVGRVDELQRMRDAWRRRSRFILLSGEAGVGKTRLAAEFVRDIDERGVTTLWGRCTVERLGAYEPFVDPVRALLRARPSAASAGSSELLRLVPELADRVPSTPSHADPGVERRLLFEAVAALLAGLGPTLLVIDDFQWADGASLALVAHLAAERRLSDVVVLGTVRSTDLTPATAGALAELRRYGALERISLDGLGAPELEELVGQIAGGDVPDDLVLTVQHATDGNPLFVEELTEHLLAGGFGTARRDRALSVPDGVQATIDRRVVDLAEGARALLRAGATLGRSFEVDLAGRLVDMDGEELLTATEDALLSGLVGEVSANHLMFAHALTQAAVYEATSTRRRLELHRRAAMAPEARVSDASADAATTVDIARHWTVVATADPAAALSAARWAVRAGDAAAAAADIDEAITRYEQADALLAGSTTEHAETLVRLGGALAAVGRAAEADERFRRALRLAEALDDPLLQARAALGLAGTLRWPRLISSGIGLEAAIARLGAGTTCCGRPLEPCSCASSASSTPPARRRRRGRGRCRRRDDDAGSRRLLLALGEP